MGADSGTTLCIVEVLSLQYYGATLRQGAACFRAEQNTVPPWKDVLLLVIATLRCFLLQLFQQQRAYQNRFRAPSAALHDLADEPGNRRFFTALEVFDGFGVIRDDFI